MVCCVKPIHLINNIDANSSSNYIEDGVGGEDDQLEDSVHSYAYSLNAMNRSFGLFGVSKGLLE